MMPSSSESEPLGRTFMAGDSGFSLHRGGAVVKAAIVRRPEQKKEKDRDISLNLTVSNESVRFVRVCLREIPSSMYVSTMLRCLYFSHVRPRSPEESKVHIFGSCDRDVLPVWPEIVEAVFFLSSSK